VKGNVSCKSSWNLNLEILSYVCAECLVSVVVIRCHLVSAAFKPVFSCQYGQGGKLVTNFDVVGGTNFHLVVKFTKHSGNR